MVPDTVCQVDPLRTDSLPRESCQMLDHTNLRQLRPSRKKLKPGDIFAMLLPDELYLFGRVILVDLPRGIAPMPGANLIYIYDHRASGTVPQIDALTPDRLLIPPQFVNRLGWSRGYFETTANAPLSRSDLLSQHCFWSSTRKAYRDETGQPLQRRTEPCGSWGLGNYRVIDDLVSDALGFPRIPE